MNVPGSVLDYNVPAIVGGNKSWSSANRPVGRVDGVKIIVRRIAFGVHCVIAVSWRD